MRGTNWWALAAIAALAGGCGTTANPEYCADDGQCAGKTAGAICHPQMHYCYPGCWSDHDCQDPAGRAYEPGRPRCNMVTHHCEALTADARADVARDAGPREVAPGDRPRPDLAIDYGPPPDGPKKKKGASCAWGGECETGYCADGVCCDGACTGSCLACDLAGSLGACTPVPAGQDPAKECPGSGGCTGSCDGKGACTFAASKGKECAGPACAAGALTTSACDDKGACVATKADCGGYACADAKSCKTACTAKADCTGSYECVGGKCVNQLPLGAACGSNNDACASKLCTDGVCCKVASCGSLCKKCGAGGECLAANEGGTCAPTSCSGSATTGASKTLQQCKAGGCAPTTVSCGDFLCNAGGTDCLTVCSGDGQCKSTAYCEGSKCTPKKATGSPCIAGNQCQSGACVDGYCCNSPCTETCMSCKLAGKQGQCLPIPDGQNPDGECLGKDAACNGSCNGLGACKWPGASQSCKAPSCATSTLSTFACDGAGACAAQTTPCQDNLTCASSTACRTSCAAHSECVTALCDLYGYPHGAAKKNTCPAPSEICTAPPADADGIQKCLDSQKPYVIVSNGTHQPPAASGPLATKAAVQVVATGTTSLVLPAWPSWPPTAPTAKIRAPDVSQYGVLINHPTLLAGLEVYRQTGVLDALVSVQAESQLYSCYVHGAGANAEAIRTIAGLTMNDVALANSNRGLSANTTGTVSLRKVSVYGTTAKGVFQSGGKLVARDLWVAYNWGNGIETAATSLDIDRAHIGANGWYGLDCDAATTGVVWNAVFNDNGLTAVKAGIRVAGDGPMFYNVTVANNAAEEISCPPSANGPMFYNSIVWDKNNSNSSTGLCSFSYSNVRGGVSGPGNIDADPLFTAGPAGFPAYDLQPGSPCINKGHGSLPVTYPPLDSVGRPRQKGSSIDMGAFEVQ